MSNQVEQKSIEALKKDFPAHQDRIDLIAEEAELFLELAKDYYICKRNLEFAEIDKKKTIADEYRNTLNDLKEEIEEFLIRNKI